MPEIQEIMRLYGASYRAGHALSLVQMKAMAAIRACRTAALGAHIDVCDECGFEKISYN